MVTIQFGYVNVAGDNDVCVVSTLTKGVGLADEILRAWRSAGTPTPLWVDGQPAALIAVLATRLGVTVGMPPGWNLTDISAEASAVGLADPEPCKHDWKFQGLTAKLSVGGKKPMLYACTKCGESQIRTKRGR
jgi:hypothetical protein